jgi:tRNA pseudouridine55 synthase
MTLIEHNGILVIDKPADTTSAQVVAIVKKLLGAGKVGHTGTLDPFATGVLACCINRATKLARFFLHGNKKYEAVLHLGIETDTQDSTGVVTASCDKTAFSKPAIRSVFKQFEGTIEQYPPVYSALKHKGTPLYKLARRGKPVQKPKRRVLISNIELLEIDPPFVRFEVSCGAGTYIRTLCSDIGRSLGCGGHLKELRRLKSSGFTIAQAVPLSELKKLTLSGELPKRIISMSNALQGMSEHIADRDLIDKIKHGNILTKSDIMPAETGGAESFIKVLDTDKDLIAVLKHTTASKRYNYCCVFNN